MASISERESREIEAANASGTTPVVFIHGLWLLPSSWANWADFLKQAGYAPLTPGWPDDPETVEEARANPDVLARKTLKQVADHTAEVIGKLEKKPAVMGHSTGGLFAQMLAGRGISAATVAIDPGVFRGVLPLPLSTLRASGPFLLNPRYRGRAITLTFDQFKYGWTNALDEDEAKRLYDTYHVAGSGIALAQMANANLNPWTESKVDTRNPDRGPLLILDGEKDHTVPWAIANASLQAAKAQPERHRDQEDAQPRPLADHRLRLAGGRADRARLRQAVRPGQAELAGLDLLPEFPGRRDVEQRTPRARLHRVVDVDALDREVNRTHMPRCGRYSATSAASLSKAVFHPVSAWPPPCG
ncbi:MAG TPA: alpha/beta hydrolase [Jiangellaceae bacterium]|nr:alpha/beta hydrolase [Jiangellaceae bacterium]